MSSYGLWLSAAGMKVQEYRQTLLANNMANAHTTGFKQDLAVITQRRVESRSSPEGVLFAHPMLDALAGGLNVLPAYHSFAQGPIEHTGKPLDVAINGDGFFPVSDGSATRYTRDGEFTVITKIDLVLAAQQGRWRVLDDEGNPMVFEESGGKVSISQDGTVRQGETVVAKLGLMTTADKQSLRKVGGNLFDAGGAKMVPAGGRFEPESREESNVDAMKGLVTMIEAARAYQLNSTLIRLQDQMTGQTVQTVGRRVA